MIGLIGKKNLERYWRILIRYRNKIISFVFLTIPNFNLHNIPYIPYLPYIPYSLYFPYFPYLPYIPYSPYSPHSPIPFATIPMVPDSCGIRDEKTKKGESDNEVFH